ncbi:hypothetical protein [Luteibacter sahnii]|uniref:hypothetical protein n=1 Tax=Luteibacter sahnii TaxID=3021977 RepID=UPI002A69D233|nr:hypothetical protein [Luteibacter sp. PPL193]MDY1547089.1 hypothetical protein [Luteibacter sp. PPL193]
MSLALGDNPAHVEPSGDRLPDEDEFYLLNVGARLAHLLAVCSHLHAIPIMVGTFRSTPESAAASTAT